MPTLPLMLMARKLLVGGYGTGTVVVTPPLQTHLGVTSGFSSVTVSTSSTTVAQFTLYRSNADLTTTDTVTYTLVPSSANGITAAYLADTGLLTGLTATFPVGQAALTVPVTFNATAPPSVDLSGSIVLSSPGGSAVIDAAASSFTFDINQAVVVIVGSNPRMDDPAGWAVLPALASISLGNKTTGVAVADFATMVAGHTYVVSADISGTAVTINDVGTLAAPIVIRGSADYQAGAASSTFKKISGVTFTISNAQHIYFRDLDLSDCRFLIQGNTCARISFERCLFYGRLGFLENSEPIAFNATGTNNSVRYVRTKFCQFGKTGVRTAIGSWRLLGANQHVTPPPTTFPKFLYIYNCHFTNIDNVGHPTGQDTHAIGMFGNNDSDDTRDTALSIYNNLLDDLNLAQGMELKTAGGWVYGNTVDRGASGTGCFFKNRHSANRYESNLWVTRPGGPTGGPSGINVRDDAVYVLNNWAATLADGAQPTADAWVAGAAADNVTLFAGELDAQLYPGNENDATLASTTTQMNAYGSFVGGNRMDVIIGDNNGNPGSTLGACLNTVGAGSGATAWRNKSVSFADAGAADFRGRGKYHFSATGTPVYVGPPAYGTAIPGDTTIYDVAIAGADYSTPPHRMLPSEVGPDAPEVLVAQGNTVALGSDYTTNWALFRGDGTGTATQLSPDGVELFGGTDPTILTAGLRMFCKNPVSNGLRVRFDSVRKRKSVTTTAEGQFCQVGIVNGNSGPPALWATTTGTQDLTVAGLATGFRISYATWNTVTPSLSDEFRCRTYNGDGTRTQVTPNETQATIDLGLSVSHTLELFWNGNTVTLTDLTSGLSQSFTDPGINFASGYLMLYSSYGSDATFINVR